MGILIIDDFGEERDFLRLVLEKAGYGPVTTAASGQEGLELLGLAGRRVTRCAADVILLDVLMPDMDGLEVCRRIRAVEHLEHLPVLMITAQAGAAAAARAGARSRAP